MAQEANSRDLGSIPGRDTSFDVPESSCLLSGPWHQLDSCYMHGIAGSQSLAVDVSWTSPSETSEAQQGAPLQVHLSKHTDRIDLFQKIIKIFANWATYPFFSFRCFYLLLFPFNSSSFLYLFFLFLFDLTWLFTLCKLQYVATS